MFGPILSAVAGRALRLPPPMTRVARVRRGLGLRATDGTVLRTDHYAPAIEPAPTVLVRTPYGRGGLSAVAARVMAEQGFHVVVQSCRGTGGSGGVFDPMRHERDDGLATVEWLRRQPWFTGRFGMYGPSYVGYTQWAIADVPELVAMATVVTASQFRDPTYSGNSFALFTTLAWADILHAQRGPIWAAVWELLRGQPRLHRAFGHLPLAEAGRAATGVDVAFFRQWVSLADGRGPAFDEYWSGLSHDGRLPQVKAAVLMVGGWQDIFLPWQLADYAALTAAGNRPQLVIGPWTHGSGGLLVGSLRESVGWLRRHLRGDGEAPAHPVLLRAPGEKRWRGYDQWPPPYRSQPWYLHSGGGLDPSPSGPDPAPVVRSDRITFDPADPTPSVGGPLLLAKYAGYRDNAAVEARPDVLVYSSAELADELRVVGPVQARLYVRTSGPHFDVFVRLCDVSPDGVSRNVCDGLTRVTPTASPAEVDDAGVRAVDVELWPLAYRFAPGHRLRVQVSGGAHPRYARNPGTGAPLGAATQLRAVEIEVWHDAAHPSAITLPGELSRHSIGRDSR